MYKHILLLISIVFAASVASAQSYVKVLVPIALPGAVPGAFGSVWRSETTILNRGGSSYFIGPTASCHFSGGFCDVLAEALKLLPNSTRVEDITGRFEDSHRSYGALLFVDQSHLNELIVETRVWDASRDALNWGARIAAVPEPAAETGVVDFASVTTASPFRSMLRIYDFDPAVGHAARIRVFRTSAKGDVAVAERTVDCQPNRISNGAIDPFFSGYAELDLTSLVPSEQSVRVQIEPAMPGLRYYALISVTNNDTQYLTILTPPRTSPTQPGAECSDPIPITHVANAIPNSYIIEFRTGIDPVSETARLEAKYGFHAQAVYQHVLSGFGAQLTEANVRGLQCESSIAAITENPAGQPPP